MREALLPAARGYVYMRVCARSVQRRCVFTPVVPPPRGAHRHPHFRPVESGFRETLRNLRFDCTYAWRSPERSGFRVVQVMATGKGEGYHPFLIFTVLEQTRGINLARDNRKCRAALGRETYLLDASIKKNTARESKDELYHIFSSIVSSYTFIFLLRAMHKYG